ncbi:hypothetical protein LB505_010686 [Fusarium chuoi]|nr:hypothetical protein LB505_010686 [Fusarium chuoi]
MNNTQQPIRFAKKPVSRKRATKACLKCRKRKVRCDVTRTSTPCTNCRLDGCECVVARLPFLIVVPPSSPTMPPSFETVKPSRQRHLRRRRLRTTIAQRVLSTMQLPCYIY